eukprot:scaffold58987_cov50-Attheya_sp.AAC.2
MATQIPSPEKGLLTTTDQSHFHLVRQILEGEGRRAFDNAAASSLLKKQVEVETRKRKREKKEEKQKEKEKEEKEKEKEIPVPRKEIQEDQIQEDPNQRRYMHRDIHKAKKWTIQQHYERLEEMNELLPWFPPDFKSVQKFDDLEISEIVESIAPGTWSGTMKVQNFDINTHSSIELIEFFERLETAEQIWRNMSGQQSTVDFHNDQICDPKSIYYRARAVFVTSLQLLLARADRQPTRRRRDADETTSNNQPDHKVEPTVPTVPSVLTFRSRWSIQIIKMSRLGGVQEHTAALDRRRVLAHRN